MATHLRRVHPDSTVRVMDQFCGAGGYTEGAKQAIAGHPTWSSAAVRVAINHSKLAIASHNANHPEVDHVLCDISKADPWRFAKCRALLASPECDNHTLARGKRLATFKHATQMDMFDDTPVDPEAERSRMLMFDVPRFAEWHQYDICIVENVVEVFYWVLYPAWVAAMEALDYRVQPVFLNAQFTGVPQSRDRIYICCWKKWLRTPDLNFNPLAFCRPCEGNVEAVQVWKKGTPGGKYGRNGQYIYLCPTCQTEVRPYYWAAANIIDWSNLGTRIGDRPRPLAQKTRERIEHGLRKFAVPQPFTLMTNQELTTSNLRSALDPLATQTSSVSPCLVSLPMILRLSGDAATDARLLTDPLPTAVSAHQAALVHSPFMVDTHQGSVGTNVNSAGQPLPTFRSATGLGMVVPFAGPPHDHPGRPLTEVLPTQTGELQMGLVVPVTHSGDNTAGRVTSLGGVLPTETGREELAVALPPFIVEHRGTGKARSVDDPLATITGGGNHHGLVQPQPFLLSYYGQEVLGSVLAAMGTVTSKERHALVTPDVDDLHFRMLTALEVKRGMGFRDDYILLGTKKQTIELAGQAVCPPTAAQLVNRMLAILD